MLFLSAVLPLIKRGGRQTNIHNHICVGIGRRKRPNTPKSNLSGHSTDKLLLLVFALLFLVKTAWLFSSSTPFKPLVLSVQQSACQQIDSGPLNRPPVASGRVFDDVRQRRIASLGAGLLFPSRSNSVALSKLKVLRTGNSRGYKDLCFRNAYKDFIKIQSLIELSIFTSIQLPRCP